jgi:hypothetical protein
MMRPAAAVAGLLVIGRSWLATGMPGLVSSDMVFARGVDTRRRGARTLAAALGLVLASAGALGCSGAPAEPMNSTSGDPVEVPPWACVPGETQPCPCADDLEGLLTCNPDGSGFGECDCSPGAVSQGPPLTSTGTEAGTGTSGSETGPGDTTMDPTGGSTSEPDPTTSGDSSSTGAGSSTGASSSSG